MLNNDLSKLPNLNALFQMKQNLRDLKRTKNPQNAQNLMNDPVCECLADYAPLCDGQNQAKHYNAL
ncbi:hypothetical protein DRO29_05590 [Candidatus Bathyarchaeota archaeon]|nr:MAG: hypothetical protein DRO29_05590 [Candidatus Bathyarchaeota archaeon]